MAKARVHRIAQKKTKKTAKTRGKRQPVATDGKRLRQAKFLKIFVDNNFHVTEACGRAGISRRTYYHWLHDDPDFAEKVEDSFETRLDDWERQLHKNIMKGDTASIIFGLKTRGKDRGYTEREFVNTKTIKILEKIRSGEMTTREAGYEFAILGLPLPEVIKIELAKEEPKDDNPGEALTPEELDKRYHEALAKVDVEKKTFVPERQAEVAKLKDDMKAVESFEVSQGKAREKLSRSRNSRRRK